MTQRTPQLNMSDMRARLKVTRGSAPNSSSPSSAQAYDFRSSPQAPQYPFSGDTASIGAKLSETAERAKGPLLHIHLYWHRYVAGFVFLFIQINLIFPQLMPARGQSESVYANARFLHACIIFAATSGVTLGIYYLLSKMRRSFQQAAQITEMKTWSTFEKGAAAIGFAVMVYLTFFYAGGVHGDFIDKLNGVPLGDPSDPNFGNVINQNTPGRFDLTPREWILSSVKCVGGAVGAVIFTRRFLAGENLLWRK